MNKKIFDTIKKVILLLAKKEYMALEKLSNGQRLNSYEISNAINEYEETIIIPKDEEILKHLDVIQIKDLDSWSIRFDLWTKENQPSDLSLELTITDNSSNNLMDIEIDGIHVL